MFPLWSRKELGENGGLNPGETGTACTPHGVPADSVSPFMTLQEQQLKN